MIEQIAAVKLFRALQKPELETLARIVSECNYAKNQVIFTQGEPGDGFYVAVEGRVKVFKVGTDGKEQILHVFGPHEPFGEVPVFEGGPYPASSAAMEACRLLYFPREDFVALLKENHDLSLKMLAVLSKRLRKFTRLVEDLSLREVPGRLAAHLLYLAEHAENTDSVELDISKGQLASVLGTIPETLSRILAKMAQQGLIETVGRRTIHLLDLDGLEDLSAGERRL